MKYKHLIDQMTLTEKCSLLTGRDIWSTKPIKRLGIPAIFLSDGPSGLRKQMGSADHLGLNDSLPATCWPSAATMACSWNPKLCEQVGEYLGKEAVAQGVNVVLGPGLNTKRSALCGRNFEYFSEDPYLGGKLAAGFIRGIQSQKIAACPKHYAVNSQELRRMASNSVLDERTLRELYLTNFEIAVKEGNPLSIMSSYNMVNGIYANENEHLLQEILVKEWGFDGAVVTDWGGSNDHVDGIKAGSHLEMPGTGGDSDRQLEQAVMEGRISEQLVNQRVDELLNLIMSMQHKANNSTSAIDVNKHHTIAEKVAEETVVLLKNESDILPLKAKTKVAVIGDFAKIPRYQGAGSSMVNPTRVDNVTDIIIDYELDYLGYAAGFRRDGLWDEELKKAAIILAKQADIVILFMGLPEIFETEGQDREHMCLPNNQVKLIKELYKINQNIVVVLAAGSPVEMPWIEQCFGLVYTCLGGQAGAAAVLNVITGKVNPSGKLAETFPIRYDDTPTYNYFPGQQRNAEYREGIYVGYRYFEKVMKTVRFPFGFGLSYTSFEYSDISVTKESVSFSIKNIGKMDGAEVAQVYIGCRDSKLFRPLVELKGFTKIFLKPGESEKVIVTLDDKAFRYYNVKTKDWEIETANYQIMVGANVQDIRLSKELFVQGTNAECPYEKKLLPSYYLGDVTAVTIEEFKLLLGNYPMGKHYSKGIYQLELNDAICQMNHAKSRLARFVYRILTYKKNKSIKKGKPDLNILFIYNMPFRGIAKMTGGMVTMDMAKAMVVMVNGHFFKGLSQLIKAFILNRKLQKKAKKYDNIRT